MLLIKSHVRGYTRHAASGAAIQVKEHEDSRQAFDKMHVAHHLTANRANIEKEGFKAGKGSGIGGDTSRIYTSDDPKYLQGLADHLNRVRDILHNKQHTKAAVEYTGHNKESMVLVRKMMDLYARHLGRPLTEREETSVIAFQGPHMKYPEIKPKFGKDLAAFIRGHKYEVVRTRARNEVGRSEIMGGERAYQEGDVFLDDIAHFLKHGGLQKSKHAPPGGEEENGKHYRGGEFVPEDATTVTVSIPEHMRGMDDAEFIAAAKEYAREHHAGKTVENASDHSQILIPWQGIKHTFSRHPTRIEAAVATQLPEVISAAKHEGTEEDRHARRNIHAVYHYSSKVTVEGEKVGIHIVVREHDDGRKYYDHYEQERPAGQSGELGKSRQGSHQPFTGRSVDKEKIALLGDACKIKNAIPQLYLLRKAARTLDGRIDFNGLPISFETGRSRIRAWKNPHDGTEGMSRMWLPYGYIRGTLGTDGDAVDVFVGPDREAKNAYIIHIMKAPDFKEYDEDKVFLGVNSPEEAKRFFFASYNDPRFYGDMTVMPFEEFKEKVLSTKGQIIKSHIREYQRRTPSGGMTRVQEHDDRRTRHNPDAPVGEFGAIPQEVAEAAGIPAGPIKLLHGKQFDAHRGFGLEHIVAQHGEEIRQAGYQSEQDFVKDVAENFNAIYDIGNGRIALVAEGQTGQKIHIIEARYSQGQKYYTVVTGYISDRLKFTEKRHKLLWRKILKALRLGMLRKSGEQLCKQLGDSLGVDWKKYDLDEFCDGMFVEEEHRDVTKGNPVTTAKIVLAHLDEDPHYYSKLAEMEKAIAPHIYLLQKRSR